MEKIILRKVDKDIYGRIEVIEAKYSLNRIACIKYGKMKDFHDEVEIGFNGKELDESCLYITFIDRDCDGILEHATFGSEWEVTFE